jgi:hypothetical protein
LPSRTCPPNSSRNSPRPSRRRCCAMCKDTQNQVRCDPDQKIREESHTHEPAGTPRLSHRQLRQLLPAMPPDRNEQVDRQALVRHVWEVGASHREPDQELHVKVKRNGLNRLWRKFDQNSRSSVDMKAMALDGLRWLVRTERQRVPHACGDGLPAARSGRRTHRRMAFPGRPPTVVNTGTTEVNPGQANPAGVQPDQAPAGDRVMSPRSHTCGSQGGRGPARSGRDGYSSRTPVSSAGWP